MKHTLLNLQHLRLPADFKSAGFIATLGALLLAALPAQAESGRGRNKKLYAVPAPANVVVDGKFGDWDWSGYIESFENSENRATQSAQLAVMYDAEALYIGAHVKDALPMLNRNSPTANAEKAWMGDCLQFRLVSDRTQPFPLLLGNMGADANGRELGQPLHLMLWYFTDDQEPALQIHKSMAMEPVRKEWAPLGVVPHANFQATYLKAEDGKGFSFEYRIPWETLNAKTAHPLEGDVVSATAQFLWGDEAGLNNLGVAYDLMSQPGFPWQSTATWGKLIFSERGNIPRQWIEPIQKAELPTPLSFSYDLPADGEVSVALYDKEKRIVRHIVAQAARKAGRVTEKWDGRDSAGKPLPPGEYTWKGIYHDPITTRYVMSIGNSGQPAWKTADNTGGWGGDYGPPTSAVVAGDTVVLGWTGHEAGWGIIGTGLNGKKKWGVRHKNAEFLATDGTRFFAPGEEGGKEVNVYAVKNGQPLIFGNGRRGLEPPSGGDEQTNKPTGLGFANSTIYLSFAGRDLIGLYEASSGELKSTIKITQPGRLAVLEDGTVIAISDKQVMRVKDGKTEPFATTNLDMPLGVAVDGAGQIYIANGGKLQNISVFSATGKYLRSIGRTGGRPALGSYDPSGVRQPTGIAVDGKGQLWVPEAASTMKRLSLWDTKSGKLVKEFFGGASYSPMVWIDPANPTEAFFDNTIWKIDLEKGTWYPKSIYYDQQPTSSVDNGQGGFVYPFRVFTAHNGRQYAVSSVYAFGTVLWIREGDTFRPLHYLFRNRPNSVLMNRPPFAGMEDLQKYPAGQMYLWSDANRDQTAQMTEVTDLSKSVNPPPFFDWMDADLNLYGGGQVYKAIEIGKDGVPKYDFTGARPLADALAGTSGGITWPDADARSFWLWRDGNDLTRYLMDGAKLLSYQNLKTWRDAINEGETKPGYLTGATMPLGTAGRYSGLLSYFGNADIVRDDGVFVSQLFESSSRGNNGPNIFYVEFLAGQIFQPNGSDRTYVVAGDQDGRVSEVLGLETVKDLSGGTYQFSEQLAQQSAKAWADYEINAMRAQNLVLARGGEPGLLTADAVGKSLGAKQAFRVQSSYDANNLYFHYKVTSPSPLVNSQTDPQTIYKGGNLLDIQIATNASADSKRTTPTPGDVRLLISRQNGKVWAVLLRPEVVGFTGKRITLTSPTGQESFDSIEATNQIELRDYQQTANGFEVTAVMPLDLLGLSTLRPGSEIRMDVGYVFGDVLGANASARAYWHNNSFTANVVNDIPNESRLEPAQWGTARVE